MDAPARRGKREWTMAIVVILAIGTFALFCVGIVYNAACAAMKGGK